MRLSVERERTEKVRRTGDEYEGAPIAARGAAIRVERCGRPDREIASGFDVHDPAEIRCAAGSVDESVHHARSVAEDVDLTAGVPRGGRSGGRIQERRDRDTSSG